MPHMPAMTPDQRRLWIRRVLGCPDLTAAQKTVLIALETYADYYDGTNAHPGEINLAEMCGLKVRAVNGALARGQELGLIQQTSPANSRTGRAAVYRLLPPLAAVPTAAATTGTAMPVDNVTTGTAMPVNEPTTGTATHHDRHRHDTTTGTAMPPTLQAPSKYLPNTNCWWVSRVPHQSCWT
ncbi:hypothetical protein BH11ACT6_BH11ACT6_34660 [soil metagenome]